MPGAVGVALLLAAAALLVAAYGEGPRAGLSPEALAATASGAAALLLVASGIVHAFRDRFSDGLRALAVWCVIGTALVGLYAYREAAQDVGYRLLAELVPGRPVPGPGGEVSVVRRADGSFALGAAINGRPVTMAFDTGASAVVLSGETAAALGLVPAPDRFVVSVQTANGRALAAPVTLDTLAVGPIVERDVRALVVRPGLLTIDLLGMSFLDRLASYEVRGSRLTLRGTPRPT